MLSPGGAGRWPDGAAADFYVFDAGGIFVPAPQIREVIVRGQRRYEVRMPSDHFAILVRKDS